MHVQAPRAGMLAPTQQLELDSEEDASEDLACTGVKLAELEWKGNTHDLREGTNYIGRDPTCNVVIDHASVSHHHATIELTQEPLQAKITLGLNSHLWIEQPSGEFKKLKRSVCDIVNRDCAMRLGNATVLLKFMISNGDEALPPTESVPPQTIADESSIKMNRSDTLTNESTEASTKPTYKQDDDTDISDEGHASPPGRDERTEFALYLGKRTKLSCDAGNDFDEPPSEDLLEDDMGTPKDENLSNLERNENFAMQRRESSGFVGTRTEMVSESQRLALDEVDKDECQYSALKLMHTPAVGCDQTYENRVEEHTAPLSLSAEQAESTAVTCGLSQSTVFEGEEDEHKDLLQSLQPTQPVPACASTQIIEYEVEDEEPKVLAEFNPLPQLTPSADEPQSASKEPPIAKPKANPSEVRPSSRASAMSKRKRVPPIVEGEDYREKIPETFDYEGAGEDRAQHQLSLFAKQAGANTNDSDLNKFESDRKEPLDFLRSLKPTETTTTMSAFATQIIECEDDEEHKQPLERVGNHEKLQGILEYEKDGHERAEGQLSLCTEQVRSTTFSCDLAREPKKEELPQPTDSTAMPSCTPTQMIEYEADEGEVNNLSVNHLPQSMQTQPARKKTENRSTNKKSVIKSEEGLAVVKPEVKTRSKGRSSEVAPNSKRKRPSRIIQNVQNANRDANPALASVTHMHRSAIIPFGAHKRRGDLNTSTVRFEGESGVEIKNKDPSVVVVPNGQSVARATKRKQSLPHSGSCNTDSSSTERPAGKRRRSESLSPSMQHPDAGTAPKLELAPEQVRIIFTGVKASETELKQIAELGCVLANEVQTASHMIACSKRDKVPIKRTPKLLIGVSVCKYIVDLSWLSESHESGVILDAALYTASDKDAEDKWGFNMVESLARARRCKPLQGKMVYVTEGVCGSSAPPIDETRALVAAAGGDWCVALDDKHRTCDKMLIFSTAEAMKKKKVQKTIRGASVAVYEIELLLLLVLRQTSLEETDSIQLTQHRLAFANPN